MNSYTMSILAETRTADLLREAEQHRRVKDLRAAMTSTPSGGPAGARHSHRPSFGPLRWFGSVVRRGSAA